MVLADQSVSEVIREGPVDGRADLERDTSYPESESADPECESDDPECESAEPENEIAGPESETAGPEINTADPESESTEPGRRPEADIINVATHDTNSGNFNTSLSWILIFKRDKIMNETQTRFFLKFLGKIEPFLGHFVYT